MKKWTAAILALILAVLPAAALAGNWYSDEGQALTAFMHKLAGDEAYIRLFTSSEEIMAEVAQVAASDFSAPEAAYLLSLPDMGLLINIIEMLGGFSNGEYDGLSEAAKQMLGSRMAGMIPMLANGSHSASWLAAATTLRISQTYIMPEDFRQSVLILEYPGEYSSAVCFAQTGEDTLTATVEVIHSGFIDGLTKDLDFFGRLAFAALFKKIDLQ